MALKWVYAFEEGGKDMRDVLGGKGANVAEMTRVLGPDRVPAGFTIATGACVAYMNRGCHEPEDLGRQVDEALSHLERHVGKKLGSPSDPLLVSVRSGARESMPGMMATVLNLGLNDESVEGLARATGNDRFAWDSYRRFVQMFGNVCRGVSGENLQDAIAEQKRRAGVELDAELSVDDLKALVDTFKRLYGDQTGEEFPQDPRGQLERAIRAVFDSWMGERAVQYRRLNHLPDSWGTAVTIQQMVFGNKDSDSCTGVAFSRDERTGERQPSGDFLVNAQGEDVVSGVRTPRDLSELEDVMPEAYNELIQILAKLEAHYKDMQDCEFTVEQGRLYMLQTRNAQRPAQAAVRFATEAVEEGLLTREEALRTIDSESLDALLHPVFDRTADFEVLARGVNASPGAASGQIVFTAEDAVDAAQAGRQVILVRPFTEADDVAGFHAAQGILTSEGGKASHAALVARGMGKPCIAGARDLEIDLRTREVCVNGKVLREGDTIAIDGSTGVVTADDVPLIDPSEDEHLRPVFERLWRVLEWADEVRHLGVRTNADTPRDARKAREFGAEGIGLCRTEHMFMAPERQPKMRAMIMARSEDRRRAMLDELLPLQQRDFEGLFEEMRGLPVTIRLLDPPLHEFLPKAEDVVRELEQLRAAEPDVGLKSGEDRLWARVPATGRPAGIAKLAKRMVVDRERRKRAVRELEYTLEQIHALTETNPMLGTRGVRLGILHPAVYEMQTRAIVRAAMAVGQRTREAPRVEIMIPLVAYERELELTRKRVERVATEEGAGDLQLAVGTMIEVPRACFVADRIALHADFFSFGTNDLTQTALGFSRDDVEGSFLNRYLEQRIVDTSPFETIDQPGVGWLVRLAAWVGREAKPDLKLGICGEHAGDPRSIAFLQTAGLDYVSCSPYRVPIARLAAAQAAIAASAGDDFHPSADPHHVPAR